MQRFTRTIITAGKSYTCGCDYQRYTTCSPQPDGTFVVDRKTCSVHGQPVATVEYVAELDAMRAGFAIVTTGTGFALRRHGSQEVHGDFETVREAADAAVASKLADSSVGVGQ